MRTLAFSLLLSLAACCPQTIDLGNDYLPLKKIVNDESDPGTFHAYVTELRGPTCDFVAQTAVQQKALLLQEQLMAKREQAYPGGLEAWLLRCKRDSRFVIGNEFDGWFVKIRYLVRHGETIDKIGTATWLSTKYGPQLDYTTAVYFVEHTIDVANDPTVPDPQ